MLKILTAVLTVLTLLLMLVTGFTLWGTLAFLLAAAALVCVCFFGKKLSGKMAVIGAFAAAAAFLASSWALRIFIIWQTDSMRVFRLSGL